MQGENYVQYIENKFELQTKGDIQNWVEVVMVLDVCVSFKLLKVIFHHIIGQCMCRWWEVGWGGGG